MHVIFIPYGIKSKVDLLLEEMVHQKFQLKIYPPVNDNISKEESIWVQGSVRILPFGVIEYIFPKEYADIVMTTLNFQEANTIYPKHQNIKLKTILLFIRKFLNAEKIPSKINTENSCIWMKADVSIIPIGIRHDGEVIEPTGIKAGWRHEAL